MDSDSNDPSYCERKKLAVGFSVFIFLGVLCQSSRLPKPRFAATLADEHQPLGHAVRGFATMSTFAWQTKHNTAAITTTKTTTASSGSGGTASSSSAVQSLSKPTGAVKTRALSTLHRLGSVRYGEDFGVEMKRTLLKGESESEDEVDRLDRIGEEEDIEAASSTWSESDDEEKRVGSTHKYAAVDKH